MGRMEIPNNKSKAVKLRVMKMTQKPIPGSNSAHSLTDYGEQTFMLQ